MIEIDIFLVSGIAVPLLMIPGVLFGPKFLRYFLMLIAIGTLFFLGYYNLSGVQLGTTVVFDAVLAPISFTEHPYSRIAVFGFTLVGSLGLLYGLKLSKPGEQAAALVALASVVGIVFSDNFITLFIFWEMLTLSTGGLIVLKRTPESLMAGIYFLSFHLAGGLVVLLGILQHYAAVGSFALTEPRAGLLFFMIGFGFKAAFLPLHVWVARGYPAANFASTVILSGLTTKIGVYAIARILPPHEVLIYMGVTMALVGVISALLQHNMRCLLSYSLISSLGFMVAGLGLSINYSVDGALLHVLNSMLYKALLFMSVGTVLHVTGTEDMRSLLHIDSEEDEKLKKNIWKALPVVTFGAMVGALAFSGFPFFNGYVSKYLLKNAMSGMGPVETIFMITSILTAALFCKLIVFGFIQGRAKIINKVPISAHLAIIVTAAFCIILGVYPQMISSLLPYGTAVDNVYSLDGIWATIRLIAAGVLLFLNIAALLKRGVHLPPVFSIEYLIFAPLGKFLYNRFCQYGTVLDSSIDSFYMKSGKSMYQFCRYITTLDTGLDSAFTKSSQIGRSLVERTKYLDQAIDDGYSKTGQAARSLADRSRRLDEAIDESYAKTGSAARRLASRSQDLDQAIDESYTKTGETVRRFASDVNGQRRGRFNWNPVEWSTKNLNFDTLILAMLLGAMLLIIFYFGR